MFSLTSAAKLQCCQVGGAFLFSLFFGGKVGGFSIYETAKTFIANSSSFLGDFQDNFSI